MIKITIKLKIKNGARRLVAVLDHVVSGLITAAILLRNYNNINESRVLMLMSDGGYGHTVVQVDIMRRLYSNAKPVVIFSSEVGRHNWKQAEIWTDVKLIHVVKSIRYHSVEQSEKVKHFILSILKGFFRKKIITSLSDFSDNKCANIVIVDACLSEILMRRVSQIDGPISQPNCVPQSGEYMAYWFKSMAIFPRRQPTLSAKVRGKIWQRLELNVGLNPKLATLYLREKGRGTDGEFRCGGEYTDYVASVRYLNKLGYTILIIGDRPLSNCPKEICDFLWDADRLRVNPQVFSIYAATESQVYICDPGGGALLPSISERPRLMINAFPFAQALPGYLMLFKRLVDGRGVDVDLRYCLENSMYDLDFPPGCIIRNNTELEILAAVKELLAVAKNEWMKYIGVNARVHATNSPVQSLGRLHYGPCKLADVQSTALGKSLTA